VGRVKAVKDYFKQKGRAVAKKWKKGGNNAIFLGGGEEKGR